MKIRSLERKHFEGEVKGRSVMELKGEYQQVKKSVKSKLKKESLQISVLYMLSILSIGSWIISLKILPFGDVFQFLLGAVVLGVNLLIFKFTKI